MKPEPHEHRVTGCSPTPLARYLKALAILRLVAEQADPTARGWWAGDVFWLRTQLDEAELEQFFVDQYRPTPVVAPWNGGSGFYPKDNREAIELISTGHAERFALFRESIETSRSLISKLELNQRPEGPQKEELLIRCRNYLPDEALAWLDAAFVLTSEGPKYPPLLGTGGNDGRLEFTNNLMQRLLDLIDPESDQPTNGSAAWWREAAFPQTQDSLQSGSILGQFDPGALERAVNPWDYVLMIEGALLFASAAVRRHESAERGTLSYPFSVRAAGVGYGSSASADEGLSRAELWLPQWENPCTYRELQVLFSEGRAQINDRPAKNGVEFARAVATLGVDRGIRQFVRTGFQARNGLAYFAVPLGRFRVEPQPQVNLLAEPQLDVWLDSFRRAAGSDHAPASAQRASRRLDAAILELCQKRSHANLQAVLMALGEAESVLATSAKWRIEAYQRPVPLLSPEWLVECDDRSPAFRLTASLAAIASPAVGDMRQHLEPVEVRGSTRDGRRRWVEWNEDSSASRNVVWHAGSLEDNLIDVLLRRNVLAISLGERASGTLIFPGEANCCATLSDIAEFLCDDSRDDRIANLLRGLVLIDWQRVRVEGATDRLPINAGEQRPDAAYALLKLCHVPWPIRDVNVPLEPAILRRAAAGQFTEASQLAARRLLGSQLPPAIRQIAKDARTGRRIAAALLFPVRYDERDLLADAVLKPDRVS